MTKIEYSDTPSFKLSAVLRSSDPLIAALAECSRRLSDTHKALKAFNQSDQELRDPFEVRMVIETVGTIAARTAHVVNYRQMRELVVSPKDLQIVGYLTEFNNIGKDGINITGDGLNEYGQIFMNGFILLQKRLRETLFTAGHGDIPEAYKFQWEKEDV